MAGAGCKCQTCELVARGADVGTGPLLTPDRVVLPDRKDESTGY